MFAACNERKASGQQHAQDKLGLAGQVRPGQNYQQEARHENYWYTDHVNADVDGVTMVGSIEDQMLLQVQRHGGGWLASAGSADGWPCQVQIDECLRKVCS